MKIQLISQFPTILCCVENC